MNQENPQQKQPLAEIEAAREAMHAAQPSDRATRLRYNYEELVGQPEAIAQTLTAEHERIHELGGQIANHLERRIYAIGCGDSWATAQAVRSLFEQLLGVPFEPLQALEFTRYASHLVGPGDVVIGLSASGTTPETARGLEVARAAGAFTIGVTMREGSAFTQIPDGYLLAHAIRRASFPTQASTASLALLLSLAAKTAIQRQPDSEDGRQVNAWLENLPQLVANIIEASKPTAEALAPQWLDHDVFAFVGAGPGLAAAMFGAAKIREGFEGVGWFIGTEEFHHYEFIHEGDPVFLVAPDDAAYSRAIDVAEAVQQAGGVLHAVVAGGEETISEKSAVVFRIPPVPPALVALPYTLPLQLAAWHIAQAKLKAGHLR